MPVDKARRTSIHVHLDDPIVNGGLNFLFGGARAAVEDEEARREIELKVTRTAPILTEVNQSFRQSFLWHMPGVSQEVRGAAVHFPVCKHHAHFQMQPLC
jgi:hypothetical protein